MSDEKPVLKGTTSKFLGGRRFVDADSGEIFDAQVVVKSAADAGFKKIWLGHILELVEEVGNAKMRVLMWLLNEADSQNMVMATYETIAKETGVSRATIAALMRKLTLADVISQPFKSVWRLNPNIIFKGGHSRRMNVLIRYKDERQQELPLTEPEEVAPPKSKPVQQIPVELDGQSLTVNVLRMKQPHAA